VQLQRRDGKAQVGPLQQLRERQADIATRWTEQVLTSYPADTATFLRRQKDPFANPVGAAIHNGLEAVVAALLAGDDLAEALPHLEDIVRIRAVQEFTPSQAMGFVLALRGAAEAAMGKAAGEPKVARELRQLSERVDALALAAFDFYTQCRQQVYELRLAELRSQVVDVREQVLAKQGKWDKLAALQEKKRAAGEPVTLPVLQAVPGAEPGRAEPGRARDAVADQGGESEPGVGGEAENNQPVE